MAELMLVRSSGAVSGEVGRRCLSFFSLARASVSERRCGGKVTVPNNGTDP